MKKMMTFALGLSLLAGSAFAAPGRPVPDCREIEVGTKPAMTEVAKTAVKMAGYDDRHDDRRGGRRDDGRKR